LELTYIHCQQGVKEELKDQLSAAISGGKKEVFQIVPKGTLKGFLLAVLKALSESLCFLNFGMHY
jgi:hypothetical protein